MNFKIIRFRWIVFLCFGVLTAGIFPSVTMANKAEFEAIKNVSDTQGAHNTKFTVRPKMEYNAENLRDPFDGPDLIKPTPARKDQVYVSLASTLPNLNVQGVIWGGAFAQAIINNKVLKIGDSIEEALITDINKGSVSLFYTGRKYSLPSPAVKNNPDKNLGGRDEKQF